MAELELVSFGAAEVWAVKVSSAEVEVVKVC